MKYKHIVFDFFGTLVSLDEAKEKGLLLKEKLPEDLYAIFSQQWQDWHMNDYPLDTFVNKIREKVIITEEQIRLIKWRVTLDKIELFEETLSVLNKLKDSDLKVYLLTNSPPTAKKLFSDNIELSSYFTDTFWSFEIGAIKPSKEIFENMLKNIKCKKNEILFIGDSYSDDYIGGKNFGIDTLLLDREGNSEVIEKIISLNELLKRI